MPKQWRLTTSDGQFDIIAEDSGDFVIREARDAPPATPASQAPKPLSERERALLAHPDVTRALQRHLYRRGGDNEEARAEWLRNNLPKGRTGRKKSWKRSGFYTH